MQRGFVKLWRRIDDNPIATKPAYLSVFLYLTRHANSKARKMIWNNEAVEIKRGQLITSSIKIAEGTGVARSSVRRILEYLENEQLIEQLANFNFRLITVKNYSKYQDHEQQSEQRVSSDLAASEQRVATNKNDKKDKNTTLTSRGASPSKGVKPLAKNPDSIKSPDGFALTPGEDANTMNQDIDRSFPRKRLYGDETLNWLLDFYEFRFNRPFTDSERWSRIYAGHLKKKLGAKAARELLEWVSDPDCWWYEKVTGFKFLYTKREVIMQRMTAETSEKANSTDERLKRLLES